MKPIAVLQHSEVGAPGTIVPILESLGATVQMIRIVDGEQVPLDASSLGGLVSLGGYMSVHDDLPWIAQELALIRDADSRGIPVAGHCLGAQLVAFALGGSVRRHTAPEIGWLPLQTGDNPTARQWWNGFAAQEVQTFQWHGDTFEAPPGSIQIASSRYCANQAFVLHDRHLMLQSHLEMTPALVRLAMERNGHQMQRQHALGSASVSDPAQAQDHLEERTAGMREILETLYRRWMQGAH